MDVTKRTATNRKEILRWPRWLGRIKMTGAKDVTTTISVVLKSLKFMGSENMLCAVWNYN